MVWLLICSYNPRGVIYIKGDRFERIMIERKRDKIREERRRFWNRHGAHDHAPDTYKYWSLPTLLLFLGIAVTTIIIVMYLQDWMMSVLSLYL